MIKNLIAPAVLALMLSSCNNKASETTDPLTKGQAGQGADTLAVETTDPLTEGQAGQGADTLAVSTGVVEWTGSKPTGQHNGTFSVSQGQLFVENNTISAGEFTIDMNSLKVLDLSDAKENADLAGHLKSEAFFQTDSFPTAKFVISTVNALVAPDSRGNTHSIAGNLTLKGAKRGVKFPAKVALNDGICSAECALSIDRTQWGVVYGSKKNIIKNLGDKFINDIVHLKIKLRAAAN
jgi:polyisoprenoid-binding protein YceI